MNAERERTADSGDAAVGRPPGQYRQGDVLLQRVPGVPDEAGRAVAPAGRTVLALGELTGHAHVLNSADGELVEGHTAQRRFVTLAVGGMLTHEEHAPIAVPAGTYEVVRQREYRPRPQPKARPRSAWVVE